MKNNSHRNWKIYIGILILASLLAAGAAYASKQARTPNEVSESSANPTIHQISLNNGTATPNELIIPLGDQIQFNSSDGKSHDISTGKGNDYGNDHEHTSATKASGHIEADEAYIVTIRDVGTYYFHDHYDPDAFITVLVYRPE